MSRPRKDPPSASADVPVLLLRPREAALAIGLSVPQVYRLIRRGDLPSVRVGTAVRVPLDALRAMVLRKLAEQERAV